MPSDTVIGVMPVCGTVLPACVGNGLSLSDQAARK
jgi:hypothetical protein